MTVEATESITVKARVIGVDVARGVALFGMMAVHSFDTFHDDGTPTPATVVAGGRSAATFVVLAGVSLAFLSGGRKPVRGPLRVGATAGIAVRAVLVGLIGLVLASLGSDADVILPHYALLFLIALPLLGLAPPVLWALAAGTAVLGPVLLVATARQGLAFGAAHSPSEPTLGAFVHEPLGVLVVLLVTGSYPVVVYLAYLCAGLAVGRLDLSSRRVATRLLVAGLGLAIAAQVVSAVLLHPLGGLARLVAATGGGGSGGGDGDAVPVVQQLLWEPQQGSSWWYLALPSPHANTPVDLAHTLGSAMAVLGAALLITRLPAAARVLRPTALAGGMTLTLYSAHVVLLTGVASDLGAAAFYLVMLVGAISFAVLWRRRHDQGPLEWLVGSAAGRTRRIATSRSAAGRAATP